MVFYAFQLQIIFIVHVGLFFRRIYKKLKSHSYIRRVEESMLFSVMRQNSKGREVSDDSLPYRLIDESSSLTFSAKAKD